MKKFLLLFTMFWTLAACSASSEFQGKNPKDADVQIENGTVTIRISRSTPYFWLEKVNDGSVDYTRLYFKYDEEEGGFVYRMDGGDWLTVEKEREELALGQVLVTIGEREIVIVYPSGTWAFP